LNQGKDLKHVFEQCHFFASSVYYYLFLLVVFERWPPTAVDFQAPQSIVEVEDDAFG
jgi:hypothetical protein